MSPKQNTWRIGIGLCATIPGLQVVRTSRARDLLSLLKTTLSPGVKSGIHICREGVRCSLRIDSRSAHTGSGKAPGTQAEGDRRNPVPGAVSGVHHPAAPGEGDEHPHAVARQRDAGGGGQAHWQRQPCAGDHPSPPPPQPHIPYPCLRAGDTGGRMLAPTEFSPLWLKVVAVVPGVLSLRRQQAEF